MLSLEAIRALQACAREADALVRHPSATCAFFLVSAARRCGGGRRARGQAQRGLRHAGRASVQGRAVAESFPRSAGGWLFCAVRAITRIITRTIRGRAPSASGAVSRRWSAPASSRTARSSHCSRDGTARRDSEPRKRWRFQARAGLNAIVAARAALDVRDFEGAEALLKRPDAQASSLAVPRLMLLRGELAGARRAAGRTSRA